MEPLRQINPEQPRLPGVHDEAAVVRRAPTTDAGADAAGQAAAASQGGMVHAMFGAMHRYFPIAGLTVANAFAQLRELLDLPEDVIALIDGRQASATARVTTGMTLEFVRASGEKGSGPVS